MVTGLGVEGSLGDRAQGLRLGHWVRELQLRQHKHESNGTWTAFEHRGGQNGYEGILSTCDETTVYLL